MNQTTRTALSVVAILLTLYVWGNCRESAGASKQRLRDSTVAWNAHSHQTDLRVSRMVAESSMLVSQLRRFARNDSVARREIARLQAKIPQPREVMPPESDQRRGSDADSSAGLPVTSGASVSGCAGAPASCDTLIATLLESRAAVDTQLTIWKALAVERGELLQRALQERDGYRNIASAWQKRAEPGMLTKLGRALPYIAAGLVIGRIVR